MVSNWHRHTLLTVLQHVLMGSGSTQLPNWEVLTCQTKQDSLFR